MMLNIKNISDLFRKIFPHQNQKILPKLSSPDPGQCANFFMPTFWGTSDATEVTKVMQSTVPMLAPGFHFSDNLLTWQRNMSMLDDRKFVTAWESNAENEADKAIIWRRYVIACAAYHCVQLDGDFVECGTFMGVGIKTVTDYLGGTAFPKKFWGYDAFEYDDPSVNHIPDYGNMLYQMVLDKFADYPQVRMIKGRIPEIFAKESPKKIAYLHIDLNHAASEIASLEHLFDRMVPGGILILDDYEWSGSYREQKIAEDLWFEARQYRVMPLPTGQGLVIKR